MDFNWMMTGNEGVYALAHGDGCWYGACVLNMDTTSADRARGEDDFFVFVSIVWPNETEDWDRAWDEAYDLCLESVNENVYQGIGWAHTREQGCQMLAQALGL